MRTLLWTACFGALVFTGCGGSSSTADLAAPDAATVADLSSAADQSTPSDLAAATDLTAAPDMRQLSCAGIYACITQCPPANLNVCIPACIARGSMAAHTYFDPLQSCSQPACYAPVDGGAGPCSAPGSPACSNCVNTNCGAQVNACLAH